MNEVNQVPPVDEQRLRHILRSSYGIVGGKVHSLIGYEDRNFRIDEISWEGKNGPTSVIAKITNPLEAKNSSHLDFQIEFCEKLRNNGIICPTTIRRIDETLWGIEEITEGVLLPFRVFDVLPGRNLECFEFSPHLVKDIGELLATLHCVADQCSLSTSYVPFISAENYKTILNEVDVLLSMEMLSMEQASMIRDCFMEFEAMFQKREHFDTGIIHSDLNETNLLICEKDGDKKISGLLDFGDVHKSFRVLDIAACILYLHLYDKLQQGIPTLCRHILSGYTKIRPFHELFVIPLAMRTRLSSSLINGLRTARINHSGDNMNYVLKTQNRGWEVLKNLKFLVLREDLE